MGRTSSPFAFGLNSRQEMLFSVRQYSQLLGKLKGERLEPFATTTIVETRPE